MVNKKQTSKVERSGKRLKSELRVYYGPNQQTILSGFSVDLSAGGLFLKTEYPLSIEDKLILIFSLPGQEQTVSCQARVAWLNSDRASSENNYPAGAGLQFVDLSLEEIRSIADFVENYQIEAAW